MRVAVVDEALRTEELLKGVQRLFATVNRIVVLLLISVNVRHQRAHVQRLLVLHPLVVSISVDKKKVSEM